MSKSIVIQESGTDKSLEDISYVVTQKYGSGTVAWMPEDEANRKEITIKKNGTVTAKSKNCYGFSKVKVNVKGGVSGKKPQSSGGDGNTHYYDTDDDGNLIDTVLPDSINITTNPTKTSYEDGQFINPAGMVVKAYKGDGTIWNGAGYTDGVIPNGELEISPIVASSSGGSGDTVYSKDGVHAIAIMCDTYSSGDYITGYRHSNPIGINNGGYYFIKRNTPGLIYYTKYTQDGQTYIYGLTMDGATCDGFISNSSDGHDGFGGISAGVSTTAGHFASGSRIEASGEYAYKTNQIASRIPESTVAPWTVDFSNPTQDSEQTITVSWDRPEDGETLSDTFNITVT